MKFKLFILAFLLFISPAYALGLGLNLGLTRQAPAASGLSMPASTQYDIDTTQLDSVSASDFQTFGNLATPTETGLSSVNFLNGSTTSVQTNDLVFTGTPGDPGAYLTNDATTDVIGNSASGFAQPDFFKKFHQSNEGQERWVGMAFQTPSSFGVSTNILFGNQDNSGVHGWRAVYLRTGTTIRFQIFDGSGVDINFDFDVELMTSTDYLILFSLAHTGGTTTVTMYLNSATGSDVSQSVSDTVDAHPSRMGFLNDDTITGTSTGFRFYWGGMGKAALTAQQVEDIGSVLATRHARTYIGA